MAAKTAERRSRKRARSVTAPGDFDEMAQIAAAHALGQWEVALQTPMVEEQLEGMTTGLQNGGWGFDMSSNYFQTQLATAVPPSVYDFANELALPGCLEDPGYDTRSLSPWQMLHMRQQLPSNSLTPGYGAENQPFSFAQEAFPSPLEAPKSQQYGPAPVFNQQAHFQSPPSVVSQPRQLLRPTRQRPDVSTEERAYLLQAWDTSLDKRAKALEKRIKKRKEWDAKTAKHIRGLYKHLVNMEAALKKMDHEEEDEENGGEQATAGEKVH